MPTTDRPEENQQTIRRQLDAATRELNSLKMKRGESLRDFAYRVKRHSDKLLSLKVAEQVQQQLLDQDAREAEEQLKKRVPEHRQKRVSERRRVSEARREISVLYSRLAGDFHSLSRRERNPDCLAIFCDS